VVEIHHADCRAPQSVMRYKVWRSNKDKELHLLCREGTEEFNALKWPSAASNGRPRRNDAVWWVAAGAAPLAIPRGSFANGHGEWNNSVQLKLSITLACACAVAGCAQDVTPVIPEPTLRPDDKGQSVIPKPKPRLDDKAAIALDCSGLLQGWNQCLLTASNTCGSRGYTILDRSDQNLPQPEDSAFKRSMHIRCNS
jgi:hypothetical protein